MKLLLILLLAGCATNPPARPADEVCYTASENAALGRAYGEAREYANELDDELYKAHKFRQSIEGLKGYCS